MPYQLVLRELIDEGKGKGIKDVGENVFFDNLPSDCKVFAFYYPAAMPNEDLESALRNLGNIMGKNLFVNIGWLNDDKYEMITKHFDIKRFPVIIVTAIDKLASLPTEFSTTYVRIDSKEILNSPNLAIECVQTIFNLFIQGKISEARNQVKGYERDALISHLKGIITNALKGMRKFLGERDIIVSLIEGKFELRRSGGRLL